MSAIVRATLKIERDNKPSYKFLGEAALVSTREFAEVRLEMDWDLIEQHQSLQLLVVQSIYRDDTVAEEDLLDGTITCINASVEKCLGCNERPHEGEYRWECACTREQRGAA